MGRKPALVRLIRHETPESHERKLKNLMLRRDRMKAEHAANLRTELNTLAAAHRRLNPNARMATTKKHVAAYFHHIHGYGIPGR